MATKNPFNSDKELLDYSGEHLLYEIEMFRWLASELPGKKESNECSAFVESFALHLRNLIDFFYTEPFDDDVVAEYFYDDPSKWGRATTATPPVLLAAKKRADKEVSHLTKTRLHPRAHGQGLADWLSVQRNTKSGSVVRSWSFSEKVKSQGYRIHQLALQRADSNDFAGLGLWSKDECRCLRLLHCLGVWPDSEIPHLTVVDLTLSNR
jgi:hypothetical protein